MTQFLLFLFATGRVNIENRFLELGRRGFSHLWPHERSLYTTMAASISSCLVNFVFKSSFGQPAFQLSASKNGTAFSPLPVHRLLTWIESVKASVENFLKKIRPESFMIH